LDVNGQYIHSHSLLHESKPIISKFVSLNLPRPDTENLTSWILVLRINAQAQPVISLSQNIKNLLLGSQDNLPSSKIVIPEIAQVETKIKSAKGKEYMKPTMRTVKTSEVTVGVQSPGVEYHQRVLSLLHC